MPATKRSRWSVSGGWEVVSAGGEGRRRGALAAGEDPFAARLKEAGLKLDADLIAQPRARRGAAPIEALSLDYTPEPGASYVALVRHPSGALTVEVPAAVTTRRGATAAPAVALRFTVHAKSGGKTAHRGVVSKVLRLLIWKVVDAVVDFALPKVAKKWETGLWKKKGHLGWVHVSPEGLKAEKLPPVTSWGDLGARNLLLLHGTFSSTEGAFRGLAATTGTDGRDFFAAVRELYGERIYGFNHLTVSETPAENAKLLLEALPKGRAHFDVVTHSRGALVLRQLTERRAAFGALADRFELGRAVLVAGPNEGTPLASPERWEHTVGWLANLLELLPDNPFTTGLEFVAQALEWIAQRATGLPGLASMDPDGDQLAALQGPPGPSAGTYAALASNFEPDQKMLLRLVDAGIDAFFATANDLVVPSEGGWRVDSPAGAVIPAERIGCYGPGGNLASTEDVLHTNFFRQGETVDLLVKALAGKPLGLAALDPATRLPSRSSSRRGPSAAAASQSLRVAAPSPAAAEDLPATALRIRTGEWSHDALHLMILDPRTRAQRMADEAAEAAERRAGKRPTRRLKVAKMMAMYRNARAVVDFRLSDEATRPQVGKEKGSASTTESPGRRFREIIGQQRDIKGFIDGRPEAPELPEGQRLRAFGARLFETLFQGEVRRLYDSARTTRDGRRLDIILTSEIDWVADLPWEFAFDPERETFLATEEINFVRNVITAIPAEEVPPRAGRLRILVVAAQPVGWGELSIDEEVALVERGFEPLKKAGLVECKVIRSASPEILHKWLERAQIQGQRFDVLHFIGHGEFLGEGKGGCLVFEDGDGRTARIETELVRQIACRRGIRIIFLNACETGMGGRSDFNRGVAQGLVAGGVPIVVGNQYKVLDASATAYAQHFYWALAHGAALGDAAREARVAVSYSLSGEAIDWAVPVVFAQNPHERLCTPRTIEELPQQAWAFARGRAAGSRRGAGAAVRNRIGVWDVNSGFPELERIIGRLNEVQSVYAFDVVEMSAPIGTWRLVRREGEAAQGYVYAEHVARRLGPRTANLGVKKLICLTTFPLGDKNFDDLYFWDDDPEQRVAVFSFAGYEKAVLEADGSSVERAIANLISPCLEFLDAHHRGAKTCPAYFNDERDPRYVAGPLAICPACEKKLAKLVKEGKVSEEEIAATRALLNAYPL